jgi:hypothetical protein
MIVAEKFVQNMLKHFTWVSFLLPFFQVTMLTFRFNHLGFVTWFESNLLTRGFASQELF